METIPGENKMKRIKCGTCALIDTPGDPWSIRQRLSTIFTKDELIKMIQHLDDKDKIMISFIPSPNLLTNGFIDKIKEYALDKPHSP